MSRKFILIIISNIVFSISVFPQATPLKYVKLYLWEDGKSEQKEITLKPNKILKIENNKCYIETDKFSVYLKCPKNKMWVSLQSNNGMKVGNKRIYIITIAK